MRQVLARLVPKVLAYLPRGLLADIEQASASAQGKGWAGSSVDDEVKACLSFLPEQEQPIALDVGANQGDWTDALLKASPDSSVWALEPVQTAFSSLKQRFHKDKRVHPCRIGISEESGSRRLYAPHSGSGLGSLYQRRLDHFQIPFEHSETVALITLDDFCARENLQPDLIKLDIEGHELAALRGARKTLEAVKVIQFEFGGTNIDSRVFWQDFWYLLSSRFVLYRLSPRGPHCVRTYREIDEFFQYTNFFAVRNQGKNSTM